MFARHVPLILQSEAPECGIACVAMIASYHGHRTDLAAMRMRLAPSMKGVTLQHIASIAQTMKLSPRGVKVPLRPGMLVNADILLEKRTVFEWVFEPVLELHGRLR